MTCFKKIKINIIIKRVPKIVSGLFHFLSILEKSFSIPHVPFLNNVFL